MSNISDNLTAYGQNAPLIGIYQAPVVSRRDPATNDKAAIGQVWVNKLTNSVFMLTSFTGGLAIWTELDNYGTTGITWTREAGANVNMTNNHGYINTNVGLTTFTTPAVSPVGSVISIVGEGTGGWAVQALAGQNFRFGQVIGGAGGTIGIPMAPVHTYASITLVTRVANTTFEVVASNDNLNIA